MATPREIRMDGFYSGICAKARGDVYSKLGSHDRVGLSVRKDENITCNVRSAGEWSLFVLGSLICYTLPLIVRRSLGGGGQRGSFNRWRDLPQGAGPEPWYRQADRSVHRRGSRSNDRTGRFSWRIGVYTDR